MNYGHYQLEDFLTDVSFLNYCLRNNGEDVRVWEKRIAENPSLQPVTAQATQLFHLLKADITVRNNYQGELAEFRALFAAHTRDVVTPIPWVRRLYTPPLFRYAAAITGILLLAGGWFFSGRNGKPPVPLTEQLSADSIPGKPRLTLPDGTRVVLNPNSKVEIADNYNVSNRTVILSGEAFFEVAQNEKLPFRVQCGNVITTALGTSFWVRYYQHETGMRVSLVTGKVKVQRTSAQSAESIDLAYLDPGQELIVGYEGDEPVQKKTFNVAEALLWKQDLLAFHNARFSEIMSKLEEWYGIKVCVYNAPEVSKHFNGEFKNKSLVNVLEALSFAHNNFEYSLQGDTVIIKFPEN